MLHGCAQLLYRQLRNHIIYKKTDKYSKSQNAVLNINSAFQNASCLDYNQLNCRHLRILSIGPLQCVAKCLVNVMLWIAQFRKKKVSKHRQL